MAHNSNESTPKDIAKALCQFASRETQEADKSPIALFYDDMLVPISDYERTEGKTDAIRRVSNFPIKLAVRRHRVEDASGRYEYLGKIEYPLSDIVFDDVVKRVNDMSKPPIVAYFDFDYTLTVKKAALEECGNFTASPPSPADLACIFGDFKRRHALSNMLKRLLPHNVYIVTANPAVGLICNVLNALLASNGVEKRFSMHHIYLVPTLNKIEAIRAIHPPNMCNRKRVRE